MYFISIVQYLNNFDHYFNLSFWCLKSSVLKHIVVSILQQWLCFVAKLIRFFVNNDRQIKFQQIESMIQ